MSFRLEILAKWCNQLKLIVILCMDNFLILVHFNGILLG